MSQIAIQVQGLSKSFQIRHVAKEGKRYRTFREELLGLPQQLFRKLRGASVSQEVLWAFSNTPSFACCFRRFSYCLDLHGPHDERRKAHQQQNLKPPVTAATPPCATAQ